MPILPFATVHKDPPFDHRFMLFAPANPNQFPRP
jgi:hypothetical protein